MGGPDNGFDQKIGGGFQGLESQSAFSKSNGGRHLETLAFSLPSYQTGCSTFRSSKSEPCRFDKPFITWSSRPWPREFKAGWSEKLDTKGLKEVHQVGEA